MHHYFEALTNTAGQSLIGYFARVINPATQAVVTLSSDNNGTPIQVVSGVANMAKTDDFGNLSLYVDPGTYNVEIYGPDATSFLFRVPNVAMNSSKGDQGDPGPAGATGLAANTFTSLASFKAASTTQFKSANVVAGASSGFYVFLAGNFTGQADDVNIVKADDTALTAGAWVRRGKVSIVDFGAVPGGNIVGPVASALSALGTANPAILVFPRGSWLISSSVDWSASRNITFRFEAGALVNQGTNTVVLPERVDMGLGARFTGSTTVTQKNKDAVALVTPPGGWRTSGNMAVGLQAGSLSLTGANNHFWGDGAGSTASGVVVSNLGIGVDTLRSLQGGTTGAAAYGTPFPTASGNLAIGDQAGSKITTGYENCLVGVLAGQNLVAGRWNSVFGPHSLLSNQNGECNTVVGSYSLVTFGGNNATAVGWAVMENHATGTNVGVGYNALGGSVTVDRSTAVGTLALRAQTGGTNNTAVGDAALRNAVNGSNNTAIGADALGILGTDKTNNTAVGNGAGVGLSNGDGNTFLGSGAGNATNNVSQSTAIGLSAQATKSNQMVLGGSNITETIQWGTIRNSTVYTVAGLPSASAAGVGARAFVSDAAAATFAVVVTGGSTNKVPVYSDGTDWRVG